MPEVPAAAFLKIYITVVIYAIVFRGRVTAVDRAQSILYRSVCAVSPRE